MKALVPVSNLFLQADSRLETQRGGYEKSLDPLPFSDASVVELRPSSWFAVLWLQELQFPQRVVTKQACVLSFLLSRLKRQNPSQFKREDRFQKDAPLPVDR